MKKVYTFSGEEPIEFDDSRSVKDLVAYAFEKFGYYEPFGLSAVTVFQPCHSRSNMGWFTQDTSRSCADEIENSDGLCFAYHIPGVLYYAEGGWGHHMVDLGNHPILPSAVPLKIKFDDFRNTIVFFGNLTLQKILTLFESAGYIEDTLPSIMIQNCTYRALAHTYSVKRSDPILNDPISDLEKTMPEDTDTTIIFQSEL